MGGISADFMEDRKSMRRAILGVLPCGRWLPIILTWSGERYPITFHVLSMFCPLLEMWTYHHGHLVCTSRALFIWLTVLGYARFFL